MLSAMFFSREFIDRSNWRRALANVLAVDIRRSTPCALMGRLVVIFDSFLPKARKRPKPNPTVNRIPTMMGRTTHHRPSPQR